MYARIHGGGGHPLLRLWGLVYGIPQGVFLFFELSMGGVRKGEIWGRVFLERNSFFFFLNSSSIISGNRDLR